jgi:hypothetical protein
MSLIEDTHQHVIHGSVITLIPADLVVIIITIIIIIPQIIILAEADQIGLYAGRGRPPHAATRAA